jgi:uncharacterized protein YkwD
MQLRAGLMLLSSAVSAGARVVPVPTALSTLGSTHIVAHTSNTARGTPGLAVVDERGIVTINVAAATGTGATTIQPALTMFTSTSYDAGQWLSLARANATTTITANTSSTSASSAGPPGKAVVALGGLTGDDKLDGTTNPASAPVGTLDTAVPNALRQDVPGWLEAHNAARALHGVGELTWDNGLADKARDNAKTCGHQHS